MKKIYGFITNDPETTNAFVHFKGEAATITYMKRSLTVPIESIEDNSYRMRFIEQYGLCLPYIGLLATSQPPLNLWSVIVPEDPDAGLTRDEQSNLLGHAIQLLNSGIDVDFDTLAVRMPEDTAKHVWEAKRSKTTSAQTSELMLAISILQAESENNM